MKCLAYDYDHNFKKYLFYSYINLHKQKEWKEQRKLLSPVFNNTLTEFVKGMKLQGTCCFIACLVDPENLDIYLSYSGSQSIFANKYTKLLAVSSLGCEGDFPFFFLYFCKFSVNDFSKLLRYLDKITQKSSIHS